MFINLMMWVITGAEYMHILIDIIPEEIIEQYNLCEEVHN